MSFSDDPEAETPQPAPVPVPEGEKPTVAELAEKKGFLPQWRSSSGAGGERLLNPEFWKFNAVRAFKRWEDGTRVTEKEFDTAVAAVLSHETR
jgi:hypothetical protein